MLTFGSLFAGIGGMDLGLERAGMRCAWQVEIDEYARRVLAKHWPAVPRYEDVRECGSHNLASVDLICGGFPCQDVSDAGKQAGIGGERSGLWSHFARIVCELRPRYVLVENVRGLLARGMGRVLGDLAEIGYDAEWESIPASAFGAPHNRERVFIVAYPGEREGGERRVASVQRGRAGEAEQVGVGDCNLSDAERAGLSGGVFGRAEPLAKIAPARRGTSLGTYLGEAWDAEPDEGWLDDGLSSAMGVVYSRIFGNAVVPQVAEWIGRRILAAND